MESLPMLKKVLKLIALIIAFILLVLIVQHFKYVYFKKSIITKLNYQMGQKYNISNYTRLVKGKKIVDHSKKLENCFKLVYEMDFSCSICLEKLKRIYSFYSELSRNYNIAFYIITPEKSLSYVKFFIDESLENYDLYIVQQKLTNDNISLYLLDKQNNIITAGDIEKYPFLKDEYIKKLKTQKM